MNHEFITDVSHATKSLPLIVQILIALVFVALVFWVLKNVFKFLIGLLGLNDGKKELKTEEKQI